MGFIPPPYPSLGSGPRVVFGNWRLAPRHQKRQQNHLLLNHLVNQQVKRLPLSPPPPACHILSHSSQGLEDVWWVGGRKLAGTLSSNSICHRKYTKHEKNMDSYPGCFADYFARRTCPFWEPSCCWTQSSENASGKPLKYNVSTTHKRTEHEKNICRNSKWIHISSTNTLFGHSPSYRW